MAVVNSRNGRFYETLQEAIDSRQTDRDDILRVCGPQAGAVVIDKRVTVLGNGYCLTGSVVISGPASANAAGGDGSGTQIYDLDIVGIGAPASLWVAGHHIALEGVTLRGIAGSIGLVIAPGAYDVEISSLMASGFDVSLRVDDAKAIRVTDSLIADSRVGMLVGGTSRITLSGTAFRVSEVGIQVGAEAGPIQCFGCSFMTGATGSVITNLSPLPVALQQVVINGREHDLLTMPSSRQANLMPWTESLGKLLRATSLRAPH